MCKEYQLELINLNVTSLCPLNCKTCFKNSPKIRNIEIDTAIKFIREAHSLGVKCFNIMGGEPLLYKHIVRVVENCSQHHMISHISTSGYGVNKQIIRDLFDGGLTNIFISLNASSERINKISRNGFQFAVNAIDIIASEYPDNLIILWVANSYNAKHFEDFLQFLKSRGVSRVCILKLKYFNGIAGSMMPDAEDIHHISECMEKYAHFFTFYLDTCFPELVCKVHPEIDINHYDFCSAGKSRCSINADATFSPCTHFCKNERFASLTDYWHHSGMLKALRENSIVTDCQYSGLYSIVQKEK